MCLVTLNLFLNSFPILGSSTGDPYFETVPGDVGNG
jgi:hypothetical protein